MGTTPSSATLGKLLHLLVRLSSGVIIPSPSWGVVWFQWTVVCGAVSTTPGPRKRSLPGSSVTGVTSTLLALF